MRDLEKAISYVLAVGLLLLAFFTPASRSGAQEIHRGIPRYTFKVMNEFPHDPSAFTQGFAYLNGFFYEGTGLNGHSSVRKVKVQTGEVVQQLDLPKEYFGEGITLLNGRLLQLTWKSGIAFVYDLASLQRLAQLRYSGEGWGLATDGHDLFMSDGTDVIRVLDPATFKEKRRINVHEGSRAIRELNELEVVDGQILSNIWHSDEIVRISPQTGAVTARIDLKGLLSPVYQLNPEAVLNGIAYDPVNKRLFVTGKLWPSVFEIKLIPK